MSAAQPLPTPPSPAGRSESAAPLVRPGAGGVSQSSSWSGLPQVERLVAQPTEPAQSPLWSDVEHVSELLARTSKALQRIQSAKGGWAALATDAVTATFGQLMQLRGAIEGAAVAVLLEAVSRGVVAESMATDVGGWVRMAADAGDAPVTPAVAGQFRAVADLARRPTFTPLVEAVVRGRVAVAGVPRLGRDLHLIEQSVPPPVAQTAIQALVECASRGDSPRDLTAAREAVIANYGEERDFEREQGVAHAHREFTAWRRDDTGRWVATVAVDNHAHAIIEAAITALAAPCPESAREMSSRLSAPLGERDVRSPGQRRADALVELCQLLVSDPSLLSEGLPLRPGSAAKAQVIVTMPLADLTSGRGFGRDGFGNVLTPAAVRQLACDARLIPAVLNSDGAVLDLGRSTRTATPDQVRVLWLRDKGCTFPGCGRPPSWCHAHHLEHWIEGGPTDVDNLALLCQRHHTLVHRHHYQGTLRDGQVQWGAAPHWDTAPALPPSRELKSA